VLGKKRDVGIGSVGMTEPNKITYSSTVDKFYFANCRRLNLLFQLTAKPRCWCDPNKTVEMTDFKKDREDL